MIELSLKSSTWIALDKWESEQSEYMLTKDVIEHFHTEVAKVVKDKVEVFLGCGADLFESLKKPGVWSDEDIHGLFKHGGIVVVERGQSTDVAKIVDEHDILHSYRKQIYIIRQDIINDTSSSRIRKLIMRGCSIKYLVPDSVINYINEHNLYRDKTLEKQVSIFGNY